MFIGKSLIQAMRQEKFQDCAADLDKGDHELGRLKKKESTSYRGSHTIECFVVRNGRARSRVAYSFIVNIQ